MKRFLFVILLVVIVFSCDLDGDNYKKLKEVYNKNEDTILVSEELVSEELVKIAPDEFQYIISFNIPIIDVDDDGNGYIEIEYLDYVLESRQSRSQTIVCYEVRRTVCTTTTYLNGYYKNCNTENTRYCRYVYN